MWIECQASHKLPCTPERAFAKCVDSERFPGWFRGYGPIAGIDRIESDGPPRLGGRRTVYNADGSVLHECITELTAPLRHAYTLDGFRPPFSWLVRRGEALWSIAPELAGSNVRWSYRFTLTSPLVGVSSPRMMWIAVVFPAPFGPRSPRISPFFNWKLKFLRASVPLYRLQSS